MFFEHVVTRIVLVLFSIFFVYDNIKRLFMNYEQCSAEIKEAKEHANMTGSTMIYVLIAIFLTIGYLLVGFIYVSQAYAIPLLMKWYCIGVIVIAKLMNLALEHFYFEGLSAYTKSQFINDKAHTLLNIGLSAFIGVMVLGKFLFDLL